MPRKQVVVKREILPDPKFNSKMLAKFVNVLMRKGKKSTAEAICYKALDRIQQKTNGDPIAIFKKAVENVKPTLEVKSRRVGGASYQVPIEVKQPRRLSLAFRWLRLYAEARPEIEKGAEMVLMGVGEHDTREARPLLLEKADVRKDEVDAGKLPEEVAHRRQKLGLADVDVGHLVVGHRKRA
mgnify:CR=1 FL=1